MNIKFIRELSKLGRKPFPKTGRGKSISFTCRDIPRVNICMSRVFTRQHFLRFGTNTVLEDTMLMLETAKNSSQRKLSEKKKRQLGSLLEEHLYLISNEDPVMTSLNVMFTKVEITNNFDKIKAYWKCKGDETDVTTQNTLDSNSYIIWQKLCESFYHATLPKITFIPDKQHLIEEEMERLFRVADYGLNYKSAEKVITPLEIEEKVVDKKIPKFLLKKKKS
uniref:Uncharacterized protein n=1 Tax=Parastrongyloides trichosuri TaxID=131310 RepID=A0A0N4ZYH7_PARTI